MLKNIGVVIQARMGSIRLPGKVLMPIGPEKKPLLQHILDRVERLKTPSTVVVATSDLKGDDVIAAFCQERNVECFRGCEENVLLRYVTCMRHYDFFHVLRMTGDNPFVDIEELDRLIVQHVEGEYDFSESFSQLPLGVGSEIFKNTALEKNLHLSSMPHHFEHVDEYILEHMQDFHVMHLAVPAAKNHPRIRLTVDTPEDFQRTNYIMENATNAYIDTEEAIRLCTQFA